MAIIFVSNLATLLIFAGCPNYGSHKDPQEKIARVYGQVFDIQDSLALEDCLVTARREDRLAPDIETRCDTNGRFRLDIPEEGTWILRASKDGYTYQQRRITVQSGDVAATEAMYLTPLDPKTILVGPEGGRDQNSDGSIELEVPPGALSELIEIRATNFAHGRALPGALPSLSHFTYACALTPDGQTFDKPVTVRMRNDRGFAPGTMIPVGVYDPDTMTWTHESMGQISDDGQWAVFDVSHFSARDCNLGRTSPSGSGEPGSVIDRTGRRTSKKNNKPCSAVRAGSLVGVADGHLTLGHRLPAVRIHGRDESLEFQYNSSVLSLHHLLWLTYDITQTATQLPDRIRFIVEVGGNRVEQIYEPFEGPMSFTYLWDGKDPMGQVLPNGTYRYRLTLANEYVTTFAEVGEFGGEALSDTGVEADELLSLASTYEGEVTIDRPDAHSSAPFGMGWGLADLYWMEFRDDVAWIRSGDGSAYGFTRTEDGAFEPLPGVPSQIDTTNDNGFRWTWLSGRRLLFDAEGRLTSIQDPAGWSRTYEYDEAGRLLAIHHGSGLSTTLTYDPNGRLSSLLDPAGRTTTFTFDDSGNLTDITNPDGTQRTFEYDDQHLLIAQTDAAGNRTEYHYDAHGSVVRVDRPDGSHTEHVTQFSLSMQPPDEQVLSFTDGTGAKYRFQVSPFGTRTHIQDPLGRTTRMERDENDRLTRISRPADQDGQAWTTAFEYDNRGRLAKVSGPGSTSMTSTSQNLTITYDDSNRLESIADGLFGRAEVAYDGDSSRPTRITMQDGRTVTYEYDTDGLVTSMDYAGMTTNYERDAMGRVTAIQDPAGSRWTYEWDEAGNLLAVTNPDGRTKTLVRDDMGRPLAEQMGGLQWTYEHATAKGHRWAGAEESVLTHVTDGRGGDTRFEYDQRHRLSGIVDPLGNQTSMS